MFEEAVYDLHKISYGRRGTFCYLGLWDEEGKERLYVCALYAAQDSGQDPRKGRLFPVILERNGEELPYHAAGTPVSVTLTYEGGTAGICLQEDSILRIEAENADVVFAPKLRPHEIAKSRGDGSWEMTMGTLPKLLFCPLQGRMEVKTGFDVFTSRPEDTVFRFRQDEEGKTGLAIHMYKSNALRLASYPGFEACIRSIETEFSAYLATMPEMPEEFRIPRIIHAYIIWSHTMEIDGIDVIYMNKGIHRCTSSWQQCYHAMAQFKNPRYAWELMLGIFQYQDDFGMLPEMLTDMTQTFNGVKPPFYGVAMEFLKEFTDFAFVSRKDLLKMYLGLSQYVFWWLSYRDTDRDGIASYDTADESGWDDCSFFRKGVPAATPDLAAYLVLAMEHLGKIAQRLGKFYEMREWERRASEMMKTVVPEFWDGKQFTARLVDGTRVEAGTLIAFVPLILGHRLPQEVIDTMADALSEEGKWLSPYGLAGERMDSPDYHDGGCWSAGSILAPAQLLVCLGLRASGKETLAKEIALRYLRAMVETGYPMILNPKTGKDISETRWGAAYPNRMAWTSAVFMILGALFA